MIVNFTREELELMKMMVSRSQDELIIDDLETNAFREEINNSLQRKTEMVNNIEFILDEFDPRLGLTIGSIQFGIPLTKKYAAKLRTFFNQTDDVKTNEALTATDIYKYC